MAVILIKVTTQLQMDEMDEMDEMDTMDEMDEMDTMDEMDEMDINKFKYKEITDI